MTHKIIALSLALSAATALPVVAETVLLEEDFDDDYSKSIEYVYDGDGLSPNSSISALFLSASTASYQPWWVLRESSASTDRFMGSHSWYTEPAQSNDWLISVEFTVPSEGFFLELDAQSVVMRSVNNVSDLSLYILEETPTEELLNNPGDPACVWESIPYGTTYDDTTDEWSHLSYSMDAYVGKTIRICFVNQNYDRDILVIDNVKVARREAAELTVDTIDEYTIEENVTLHAQMITALDSEITQWTATFTDGATTVTRSGENPEPGSTIDLEAEFALTPDATTNFTITFQADELPPLGYTLSTTRLAFATTHRVFLEETTGTWCGNCPLGMYNMECMHEDPEIGPYMVSVAVHTVGTGAAELMIPDRYGSLNTMSVAPIVYVERNSTYTGFTTAYDAEYDPTNEYSFAYNIKQQAQAMTLADIELEADWVIAAGDTTSVVCRAIYKPALSATNQDRRIGFVLTENNVGMDNSQYWIQCNYFAGYTYSSRLGGWCDLPEYVYSSRWHDVARVISEYNGHEGSIPTAVTAGEDYTFEYTIDIPDLYQEDSNGRVKCPAISRENCELAAFVYNAETGRVENAVRIPLGDAATNRFSIEKLAEAYNGINTIVADPADAEGEVIYFDLHGRRVNDPQGGIFIRRQGNTTAKVIL